MQAIKRRKKKQARRQKHTHTTALREGLPIFVELIFTSSFICLHLKKTFDSGSPGGCWRMMTSAWESRVFLSALRFPRLARLRWTTVGRDRTCSEIALWTADQMVGTTGKCCALIPHPSVITRVTQSVVYCRFYSDQYRDLATGPQQPEQLRAVLSKTGASLMEQTDGLTMNLQH